MTRQRRSFGEPCMAQPDRSWGRAAPGAAAVAAPATPGAHRGSGHLEKFGNTDRTDAWWFIPVLQAVGLLVLIGYANYAGAPSPRAPAATHPRHAPRRASPVGGA